MALLKIYLKNNKDISGNIEELKSHLIFENSIEEKSLSKKKKTSDSSSTCSSRSSYTVSSNAENEIDSSSDSTSVSSSDSNISDIICKAHYI